MNMEPMETPEDSMCSWGWPYDEDPTSEENGSGSVDEFLTFSSRRTETAKCTVRARRLETCWKMT